MKKTTEEILKILNDETVNRNLESISSSHAKHEHLEVTMAEAYENFLYIKELIIKSSELGVFDDLPLTRRSPILNNIKTLASYSSNVNKAIGAIETTRNIIVATWLERKLFEDWNIKGELAELSKLKSSYTRFNNKFKETKKNLEFIDSEKENFEEILKKASKELETIKNNNESASKELKSIETKNVDAQSLSDKLKEKQKEVESLKLNIESFSDNIDQYKKSIDKLINKGESVVSKESKITELIEQARKALNLKSAQGISAAFASKYEELKEVKANKWIFGASALLFIAVLLTVWSLTGWGINNPGSFGSIAGRIVAVGIAISGAAFCANQFIKQKNIAEDYAYKAVLSKSIIAFANYIKETDETPNKEKVSEYLTTVLEEIHKDPLRERKTKKVGVDKNNISQLKEISELFNK